MDKLIKGLRGLKNGALTNLMSIGLSIIGLAIVMKTVHVFRDPKMALMAFMALGSIVILFLVSAALGIVSFVLYFNATGHLKRYRADLGIGRTGMILLLAGIILMFVDMFIVAGIARYQPFTDHLKLLILVIVSMILLIIGAVFFGIMLMRLGEIPEVSSSFKTAGILYILGFILSIIFLGVIGGIIGVISTVLIYKSAKESLSAIA